MNKLKNIISFVSGFIICYAFFEIKTKNNLKPKIEYNYNINNFDYISAILDLENVVRQNLKDPDSYIHVESYIRYMNGYVIVEQEYLSKNNSNNLTKGIILAKFNTNSKLIKILETNEEII